MCPLLFFWGVCACYFFVVVVQYVQCLWFQGAQARLAKKLNLLLVDKETSNYFIDMIVVHLKDATGVSLNPAGALVVEYINVVES